MRYTYGIMDERKILLYKPQLFLKDKDLLVFSSSDFLKWHNDIREYLDALYQIDSLEMEKGNSINMNELDLAMAVLNNVKLNFENIFDSDEISISPYMYLSTLDKKYKRHRSSYTSDMRRCDVQIPVITQGTRYKHLMEIINEANNDFSKARKTDEDEQDYEKED